MKRTCAVIAVAVAGAAAVAACGGQPADRQPVTGVLIRVGGPAGAGGPPPPLPLPGEVTARSATGARFSAVAGKDGRFRLALPPGTYRLTGRSPQVAGGLCFAPRPLHVTAGRPPASVKVICSIS